MGWAQDPRISNLLCPMDGSWLRAEPIAGPLDAGLLVGDAMVYPVIFGIPRLTNDTARAPLVAMLRRGDIDAAGDLALAWPDKGLANRLRRKASSVLLRAAPGLALAQRAAAHLSTGRRVRHPAPSVEQLLRHQHSGFFTDWLLHRFTARTFKPLIPLSRLIAPTDRVLDIGGGLGHGAWVLSARVPPARITLVDAVFSHLYVAKSRMVPGTAAIAADAGQRMPFQDNAFDCIVMSDTFHFVPDQPRLASDAQRLLAPGGRLILSQIHNGLIRAAYTGHARSPQGYLDLFPSLKRSLITNTTLLAAERFGEDLDLTQVGHSKRVETEAELSLVADFDGASFQVYPAGPPDLRNPQLASVLVRNADGTFGRRTDISPIVSPFLDWPDPTILTATVDPEKHVRHGARISVPHGYLAKAPLHKSIQGFM